MDDHNLHPVSERLQRESQARHAESPAQQMLPQANHASFITHNQVCDTEHTHINCNLSHIIFTYQLSFTIPITAHFLCLQMHLLSRNAYYIASSSWFCRFNVCYAMFMFETSITTLLVMGNRCHTVGRWLTGPVEIRVSV